MRHPQANSRTAGVNRQKSAEETLNEVAAIKMEGAELANTLRNLLRSAKGGIPLKRLDDEFYTFAGVHIPLGAYRNLEELLKTLPDVCSLRSNDRGHIVVYVSTWNTRDRYLVRILTISRQGDSTRFE